MYKNQIQKLFDVKTAATILSVSKPTIWRLKKSGQLKYHRIGDRILFSESDLQTFIDLCAVDPIGGKK